MSNNTIQLNLKATDNASGVVVGASDKIAASLKGVTDEIKQQTVDYKGLVVGMSGAATASFGLYNAFDNVMDASVGVNKANLAVKIIVLMLSRTLKPVTMLLSLSMVLLLLRPCVV